MSRDFFFSTILNCYKNEEDLTQRILVLLFGLYLGIGHQQLNAQDAFSVDSLTRIFQAGEYETVINKGLESLSQWDRHDTINKDYAEILRTISRAYIQVDAFNDAFKINQRALDVFLALNDSLGAAQTYSNFAGIKFYLEDSAKAFEYLNRVKDYYPDSVPQEEQDRYTFMWALLYMQFGTPERAIEIMDSLLPELDEDSYIYNYVLASSIDLMDSTNLVDRYDTIIPGLLMADILPDLKLAAVLAVVEGAHELGREDVFREVMPILDSLMALRPESMAISHKTNYYLAKAWLSVYNDDYELAYEFMVEHSNLQEERDSIQGAEDVRKLEAQVRLKDAELNTRGLKKALQLSQQRTFILIGLITVALILAFVFYRLNRSTKEKNLAIAEVSETRERMLSILSHDMRSPVSQLKALLEAFDAKQLSDQEMKELIPQIKEDTDITLKMLDQTVAWININRGDFKRHDQEFSLKSLFLELEGLLKSKIQFKDIRLIIEAGADEIRTDRFLLRAALLNLLSNALKFSHQGGEIVLRSQKIGAKLQIQIIDDGVGIPRETLVKIQNAISVSTSGTKSEEGGGLGLSIVRDACRHMNARLSIESEAGKGTTCTIQLNT